MNKLILSLASVAAVVAPICTVVSCGMSKSSVRDKIEKQSYDKLTSKQKEKYHFVKTETETVLWSFNNKNHLSYKVYQDDDGNEVYQEIGG